MDLHHPPEPVPGMEMLHPEGLELFRFSPFLKSWRDVLTEDYWIARWIGWVITVPLVAVVLYAPPMLYRLSLKSTSLVYLPFLWVIRDSFHSDLNLRERLIDLKHSSFERLKRWYAGFVLVGLNLVPLALYLVVHSWAAELLRRLHASVHPGLQTLLAAFLFLQPDQVEVKGWHVARFLNASITLWMFWFAESKLRLLDFHKPVPEGRTTALLNSALLVRGTLTLYIIFCTLYLLLGAVDWHELARLRIKWFPWSP